MDNITQPRVSIIIPTFNRANYIMETIDSICKQTYQNWELIIMDDGSDDNTEEMITQLKDEKIRFYKSARTGMVSILKNKGIQKAGGELIAFNDSDDLWSPVKLEKQVAALQQYPEAGFCLTNGYEFRLKEEPLNYFYKLREGLRFDNIFISFFKSEVAGFTQALLFRKQCVATTGFFNEAKPSSDPEFIVSLASHFKAVILFEPLFYRRLHGTNRSSQQWEERYHEWVEVIRSYQKKKLLPSRVSREALFKLYINFGEDCLLLKDRRKAIVNFMKAWKNKPFSIIPFKKTGKAIVRWVSNK